MAPSFERRADGPRTDERKALLSKGRREKTDGRTEGRKHGRANGEWRFGGPLDSKIIIVVVTVEEGMWVTVAVGEGAEA